MLRSPSAMPRRVWDYESGAFPHRAGHRFLGQVDDNVAFHCNFAMIYLMPRPKDWLTTRTAKVPDFMGGRCWPSGVLSSNSAKGKKIL